MSFFKKNADIVMVGGGAAAIASGLYCLLAPPGKRPPAHIGADQFASIVADNWAGLEAGGFDNLHLAYYKNQDIGQDGVWDVWQVEGPNMVWFFRGEPHVHCWAHIKEKA